jgi:hypothetical protein
MSADTARIVCRNCKADIPRAIRCCECHECPICCGKGFLRDGEGVIPCYNCNPDGMEDLD